LTCSENGRQALWTAKKAAATPLSLYLAGETGTGKEVLAHLIHAWSPRKSGPFVPIHCGALPISLAESELFGHVKGAFTGAVHHRPGALMQAHGGTLFLDEIGDLPLDIQVKLLRFLENGEIRPIGADRTSRADVRLVCATHHPLQKLVAEGKFRQDLFYRLASVTIDLPTLRSRPDDIEMLAVKFAHELERILSPRSLLRLQAHAWPGNVRELRHAIERASGLYDPFTSILGEDAFQFLLTPENIGQSPDLELGSSVLSLHEMERVVLLKALKLSRGNRAQAAKILGVARSTLFEMLKRHRIAGPRSRVGPKHH
jgi:transcriptional regulator with PAS, ATPase and Fis domain